MTSRYHGVLFLDDNKTNDADGKENGTHFRHPTDLATTMICSLSTLN